MTLNRYGFAKATYLLFPAKDCCSDILRLFRVVGAWKGQMHGTSQRNPDGSYGLPQGLGFMALQLQWKRKERTEEGGEMMMMMSI